MATETYRWFKPDSNLRSGTAILNGGDSAELTPFALMMRAICNARGLPANGTRYLFDYGTATDGSVYARVPDYLWPAVSGDLTAAETSSIVTTLPTGWGVGSFPFTGNPNPRRKNFILRGDSISAGLGTAIGDPREVWLTQALSGISGETLTLTSPNYREGESKSFYMLNIALGGSSWGNTVPDSAGDPSGQASYPRREDLAFEQRTATLALNGVSAAALMIYWLGTNDLAYDVTLSAADAWARVATRIAAFRTKFPTVKIALCTVMKRSEGTPLNTRINAFNNLMRANYQSIGANTLIDFEANIPEVNILTGDTNNKTIYTDGTHITTYTHGLLGAYARPILQAAI